MTLPMRPALEMAPHEEAERRALEGEVAELAADGRRGGRADEAGPPAASLRG